MSFLTPLYALGLLAIAAPIVFHLIRKSPRGEVPFSSLMFLAPSPPRLTRKSRLNNILLLILRGAALGLLAFAFTRPFLRQAASMDFSNVERRRIAVLLDTSASMRRGDLWNRATALAKETIAGFRPTDQVAVFAFESTWQPVLGFEESASLDPAKRQAVINARIDRLAPTWGATRLGQALIDGVSALEEVADSSEKTGRMPRRVVLVGDLQQGSHLEALGDFDWPSDVELELKPVSAAGSNAGLQRLADSVEGDSSASDPKRRVRVFNDASSKVEKFTVVWVNEKGAEAGKPTEVYVPPGESRVVHVPEPADLSPRRSLRLKGDSFDFDNTVYFADEPRDVSTVLYVGADEPNDPMGLRYYLDRAVPNTPRRIVHVVSKKPSELLTWEPDRSLPLIVLTTETTAENVGRLRQYMRDGGTVLDVVATAGTAKTLAALAETSITKVEEANVRRDMLLGEIAFDHPLFAPLAAAQFNDFTKIHFWKYRRLGKEIVGDGRVLARFESGDPAVVEKVVGKGRLVVLASGWNPVDSQLARSSKFVPLIAALMEKRNALPFAAGELFVHDRVPLPPGKEEAKRLAVHKPDGAEVKPEPAKEFFLDTDEPGVYRMVTTDGSRFFAVNVDPLESKTSPLHVETLEQFGCRLANPLHRVIDPEQRRQMHNAELENRQKVWRWLIVAAIGVLIVETWLAGRLTRSRAARAEALAS